MRASHRVAWRPTRPTNAQRQSVLARCPQHEEELRKAAGDRFRWRTEMYEFVTNLIAIDLLFGSDRERKAIEAGADWREIGAEWENEQQEFGKTRRGF